MLSKALLAFGITVVAWAMMFPLRANYLDNPDFGVDLSSWHGDGERVYLKADGTEGTEADSDAVPVIKLALAHGQARSVSQEIDLSDKPGGVHVQVDMYASSDFQRSKFASDYTVTERYKTLWEYDEQVMDTDFWIRLGPGVEYFDWLYTIADAKPGKWETLKAWWPDAQKPGDHFTVYFSVPPGTGCVYLKNPIADK
jgi:hypothetical protein